MSGQSRFAVGDEVVATRDCPYYCGCVRAKYFERPGTVINLDSPGTPHEAARVLFDRGEEARKATTRWIHAACLDFGVRLPDGVWID